MSRQAGAERKDDHLPADVGAHTEGAPVHCDERALPAGGAAGGHVPVERIRRPPEDVVVRLAPLRAGTVRAGQSDRQALTHRVCGTFVRTKGTAPCS